MTTPSQQSPVAPPRSKKALMFGHMPGQSRWACDALFALGLLGLLICAIATWWITSDPDLEWHIGGKIFAGLVIAVSLAAWVVCALIALRLKIGWWLAWPLALIYAINVPVGTAGAIFLLFGLISADMKQFLEPSTTQRGKSEDAQPNDRAPSSNFR